MKLVPLTHNVSVKPDYELRDRKSKEILQFRRAL